MTSGQIYNKNKEIYDKEAIEYIDKLLQNVGSYCHRPFEMMTSFSRIIVEKITEDLYLTYEGYVRDTKYTDYREIESYSGKKDNAKIYTKQKLIEMFGFEISLNPRSKANRSLQNLV